MSPEAMAPPRQSQPLVPRNLGDEMAIAAAEERVRAANNALSSLCDPSTRLGKSSKASADSGKGKGSSQAPALDQTRSRRWCCCCCRKGYERLSVAM